MSGLGIAEFIHGYYDAKEAKRLRERQEKQDKMAEEDRARRIAREDILHSREDAVWEREWGNQAALDAANAAAVEATNAAGQAATAGEVGVRGYTTPPVTQESLPPAANAPAAPQGRGYYGDPALDLEAPAPVTPKGPRHPRAEWAYDENGDVIKPWWQRKNGEEAAPAAPAAPAPEAGVRPAQPPVAPQLQGTPAPSPQEQMGPVSSVEIQGTFFDIMPNGSVVNRTTGTIVQDKPFIERLMAQASAQGDMMDVAGPTRDGRARPMTEPQAPEAVSVGQPMGARRGTPNQPVAPAGADALPAVGMAADQAQAAKPQATQPLVSKQADVKPEDAAEVAAQARSVISGDTSPAAAAAQAALAETPLPDLGASKAPIITQGQMDRAQKSFMDRYREVGAPIVVEELLRQGKLTEAAAFQEWMDTSAAQAGMKNWANATAAIAMGDFERFAEQLTEAYNRLDYMPDGMSVVKEQSGFTRDEKGNITGARVTYRDNETGATNEQVFDDPMDLVYLGLNFMDPINAFNLRYQEMQAANEAALGASKSAAETAAEIADERLKRITDAEKALASQDANWGAKPEAERNAAILAYIANQDALVSGEAAAPKEEEEAPTVPVLRRP